MDAIDRKYYEMEHEGEIEYFKELNGYAKHVMLGLAKGKLDNPSMEIDHALNQKLRRKMKIDKRKNESIALYICYLCMVSIKLITKKLDHLSVKKFLYDEYLKNKRKNDEFIKRTKHIKHVKHTKNIEYMDDLLSIEIESYDKLYRMLRYEEKRILEKLEVINEEVFLCATIGEIANIAKKNLNKKTSKKDNSSDLIKIIKRYHEKVRHKKH